MAPSWFTSGNIPYGGEDGNGGLAGDIVPIPDDTLGLRILGPALFEADIDIIAVHGLGGDAFTTWTAPNGKMWLRDFLPDQLRDPPDEFKSRPDDTKMARVMTFGYDANIFTRAATQRTFTFAEVLLAQLNEKRGQAARRRPLMLIGHSLGGIVIKKALIMAQARQTLYGDILRSVVHLSFFGTPHQGVNSVAGFFRGLGSALTRAKERSVLTELQLWSPSVIETNALFAEIADGFTISTFFETNTYLGVQIVDEGSARLNKTRETALGLDRNHITICKFASVDEACYRQVFGRLHAEISAIGTEEQVREQELRVQWLLQAIAKLLQNEPAKNFPGLNPGAASSQAHSKRSDILNWVPCTDFRDVYGDHLKKLYPGIGERLLSDVRFKDWFEGRSKRLWCHGMPGAGKTAFATIVIRHIGEIQRTDPKVGLAYLYCSHLDKNPSALLFVQTMLHQLIEQSDHISPEMLVFYERHMSVLPPRVPGIGDFEQVLGQEIRHFDKVYVVVDALDECKDDDNNQWQLDTRSGLLQSLCVLGDTIHLLITSRDEHSTTSMNGFEEPIPRMKIITTNEDIMAYIDGQLANTTRLKALMTPTLILQIKETIVAKAQGMFLPAQLLMNILANIALKRQRRLVMNSLQNLPSFSDETIKENYQAAYKEILKNIWDQAPTDADLARKVMSWIIFAKDLSNLTISVVQGALALENDDCIVDDEGYSITEQDLLSVCRGLVTIDDERRIIRFVHYTATTYFASEAVQRELFQDSQKELARVCLKCILLHSSDHNSRLYDHPLYKYASRYWGQHARVVEQPLLQEIQNFLGDTDSVSKSFQVVDEDLPRDWKPQSSTNSEQTPHTSLHVTAYFGLVLTAERLLVTSLDPEIKDLHGWTPMRWAIIGANVDMIRLLLRHGASLISADTDGQPTVFWVVGSRTPNQTSGSWRLTGSSKGILGEVVTLKSRQSFGTVLPNTVVPRTSSSVLETLLDNLPNADVRRSSDGRTLLSIVAENWLWDAVNFLLERDANVNLGDEKGMTPLLWALQPPRRKTVFQSMSVEDSSRLSIGTITNCDASTQLDIGGRSVSEEIIEPTICRLIGKDLEAKDGDGRTALSLAAENRFHQVLSCLLDRGADPNTFDKTRMTPLHYACSFPRFETVDINELKCCDAATVRLGTAKLPQLPLETVQYPLRLLPPERSAKLLLQRGAPKDAMNASGLTALSLATFDGLESMVALLSESNAGQGGNLTSSLDGIRTDDYQDTEDLKRRDYIKLLLAMLDRRARFRVQRIRVFNSSMLLISSISDILELQASDASQVLITDRPNLTHASTSDASVIIIRAAATIDRLIASHESKIFMRDFSQISYLFGSNGSRLSVDAKSTISELTVDDRCRIVSNGTTDVGRIQALGRSKLDLRGDSNISTLFIGDNCSVIAKGKSEIRKLDGHNMSKLRIKGNSQISELSIYDECSVTAKGSKIRKLDGHNMSKLRMKGNSQISELSIYDKCSVIAEGSEIRRLRGNNMSKLRIESNSQISELFIYDDCFVIAEGSEIRGLRGSNQSKLRIGGNSRISELFIDDECLVIAQSRAEISRFYGSSRSSLFLEADTSISELKLCDWALLLSRGGSSIRTAHGDDRSLLAVMNDSALGNSSFFVHQEAKLFLPGAPDSQLLGDVTEWTSPAALASPLSRRLSEAEAMDMLKAWLWAKGDHEIISRLDMDAGVRSMEIGDGDGVEEKSDDGQDQGERGDTPDTDEEQGDDTFAVEREDWCWVEAALREAGFA